MITMDVQRLLSSIDCGHNAHHLRRFLDGLAVKGNVERTKTNQLYALRPFLKDFRSRDLGRVNQFDIATFLEGLPGLGFGEERVQYIRRIVRAFLTQIRGKEFASFIRVKIVWSKLRKSDLIGREELTRLIESCTCLRNKAIFSMLYDGALRRQELLNLRLCDLDLEGRPAHITVCGTKGQRTIPLTFSAVYLKQYLKAQGRLGNRKARLWEIGEAGLAKIIWKAGRKTRMEKRLYPYLFRHSRLTELANHLTDQQLKYFAGWVQNSKMMQIYCHLSTVDLDGAVARIRA